MTEDMVLTPGGYRHKSLVHVIEPGHVLDLTGGSVRKLAPSGQVVADYGLITARPDMAATLGTDWISDAFWQNNSGSLIASFTATWDVPPPPYTQSGQFIYLFNGLQPTDTS